MVVEHAFVTTLEGPDALRAASEFLRARGFTGAAANAFEMGQAWTTLEMRRGRERAARAKSVSELPQVIRVDYDRGRVSVAISIAPSAAWGGDSFGGTPNPTSKKLRLHGALLTAIAGSLERLLSSRMAPETAVQPWDAVEQDIATAARKRRRRNFIILAIVVLLFAAAITIVVIAANSR